MCLIVCLGFVCACGGEGGWCYCVSREVCVFVFGGGGGGGVCRSRNSLLGWSDLRTRVRRVCACVQICVCVCIEDIAIYADLRGRHISPSWHSTDVEIERDTHGESEMRGQWLNFAPQ